MMSSNKTHKSCFWTIQIVSDSVSVFQDIGVISSLNAKLFEIYESPFKQDKEQPVFLQYNTNVYAWTSLWRLFLYKREHLSRTGDGVVNLRAV